MKILYTVVLLTGATAFASACSSGAGVAISGKACLGTNSDSLVEGMEGKCEKGDAIATKNPSYFCDFNYAVAYNDFNSAYCIYSGAPKEERVSGK